MPELNDADSTYVFIKQLKQVQQVVEAFAVQQRELARQARDKYPANNRLAEEILAVAAISSLVAEKCVELYPMAVRQKDRVRQRTEEPRKSARVEESADSGLARRDR